MAATLEITRHWARVAALGCILTRQPATVAHCHGGSVSLLLGADYRPGVAQRQNHWLVLPLSRELHQGAYGLDTHPDGVAAWEALHGTQVRLLEELSWMLGYCVFERAGVSGYRHASFRCPD